jgi:ATP/maltotriose-dependent transcriptional regulator MalT
MRHPLPWLSASLLALLLSGCDIPAPHVSTHAKLHIAANGTMELDHQPLAPEALLAQLQARAAQTPDVMVEIHASPKADMAAIKGAIATIKQAHARLSFDDEFPASAVDKRDVPSDL